MASERICPESVLVAHARTLDEEVLQELIRQIPFLLWCLKSPRLVGFEEPPVADEHGQRVSVFDGGEAVKDLIFELTGFPLFPIGEVFD
jgi:hypothetical protein